MDTFDQTARYLKYLARFGITEGGNRVTELSALKFKNVHFFAYASSDGVRLKAALTPSGIVTPGRLADDDWYGFLSEATDAMTAAERIAWLETDSSTQPHGLPRAPVLALDPDRRPASGIDPAEWALVTPPTLSQHPDGSTTLVAWFLPSGARVPERWSVTARVNAAATIAHASAFDLLVSRFAGADAAASDATLRARELLDSGTDDERLWAVQRLIETGEPAAVNSLTTLLENPTAAENIKVLAVAALANCANPAAVAALGAALRKHPLPSVRRACAQSLGRVGGAVAMRSLAAAAAQEPEVIVRAEIVNALTGFGGVAREALAVIARDDRDEELRALAQRKLEASA
jgi:hypothetical protein